MKFSIALTQALAFFTISSVAIPVAEVEPGNVAQSDGSDPTVDAQFFWKKTKTVYETVRRHPVTITKTKTKHRTGEPVTVTITKDPEIVFTTVFPEKPPHRDDDKDREHHKRDDNDVDAQFFWKKKTVTITITEPPETRTEFTTVTDGTVTTKVPGSTITKTVTKSKKH